MRAGHHDDDQIGTLALAVSADQILLRALICAFIEVSAQALSATEQRRIAKAITEKMIEFIDGYSADEGENVELERARELARRDLDLIFSILHFPERDGQ